MKKEFMILILGMMMINLVSASNVYYNISLLYEDEKIIVKDVDVIYSSLYFIEDNIGEYSVEVLNQNVVLGANNFIVPNVLMYDLVNESGENFIEGGEEILDKVSFNIYIPYNEKGQELAFYNDKNQMIGKGDISTYSKIKTKAITGEKESVFDEDLESENKENKSFLEKIYSYWWVLVIILGILIAILFKPKKNVKIIKRR
ncbi:MAG: hypothetical protein WC867_02595 [Candidatus Pacearchaeota archaeon]|jgi:hypothetical protein